MNLETSATLEAIRAGSDKILFTLYETYRNEFVSWCIRNHQITDEEARDIFQDAMVGLYRNVMAGKVTTLDVSIKTYLFSIGKNLVLNLLKRKAIEAKAMENFELKHDNSLNESHENQGLLELVKRLYKVAGSPCKEILEMYYQRGFDMETIAIRVGYKNSDVAKKKKYECIKALEERIKLSSIER